ncbi:MAG TPA: ABC transporter ATP-binding protein [Candidatus Sulfomarinibacteraceae bacterium]|nr:ABC transporter ATP-binding protein [Candidatus Sulfomarinibacteraceae bacterium]
MNSRTRKFLSYYKPYRRLLAADMTCAMVVTLVALILPLCTRLIMRYVLEEDAPALLEQVYAMGTVMLVLVAIHAACNFFVDYRGHTMGALMERDMRGELFAHYQKLPFRFYDEQRTGQLMSRITTDLFWLAELFHHGPEDLLIGLLTLAGVFAVSMTISVELTVIIFLFVPVMALYAFHFNKRMNAALRRSKERIGDVNAQVEDTLAGIRVVKSFTNEAMEREKFAAHNDRFVHSRRAGYRSEAYFSGGMIAFSHLITVAVVVFGGASIANASLDAADLVTYLLYVGLMIEPVRRLVNFARLYQEGITGFTRFMEILEIEPEIRDAPGAVALGRARGDIVFNNVSFRYNNSHDYVLRGLCLHIRAGEYVALVGFSGVGKTTLCSLIPRFYDVCEGSILLDGRDIREIRLRSLRRNIGVVHQDVYLFAGTVAENIGYGEPRAGRAQIVKAAKRANAHAFIQALPGGYDTDIGQRGVRLSGGQKQRLSIARAFLKDPPVIIFDEATSSLDNESERAIQASLEALAHDRTTIVIAHRLSTVMDAQRIVVLTEKGIAEQGAHEALMTRNGSYARLYHMQRRI